MWSLSRIVSRASALPLASFIPLPPSGYYADVILEVTMNHEQRQSSSQLKAEAINKGESTYYTGIPCVRGHLAPRSTKNSVCSECHTHNTVEHRKTSKYQRTRRKRYLEKYSSQPELYLYDRALGRSRRKNLPFSITPQDIKDVWPSDNRCPVLGIPLVIHVGENGLAGRDSPSLDRIIPSKGYVQGNIAVLSLQANSMKVDCCDPESFRRLAAWLESKLV